MILEEHLVKGLYNYFYTHGLRDRISKEKNTFFVYNFGFIFEINKEDLEVLFFSLNDIDFEKFQQHLQDVQESNFWADFPEIKKRREMYEKNLLERKFVYKEGNFYFKAEFNTQSDEEAVHSVLDYLVRPVLLFSRKKE